MQIRKFFIILITALMAGDASGAGKASIPPEIVGEWRSQDFKTIKSKLRPFAPFPGDPVDGFILYLLVDGKAAWFAAPEIGDVCTAVYQASTKTLILTDVYNPTTSYYLLYDNKTKTLRMTESKSPSADDKTPNGMKITRMRARISTFTQDMIERGIQAARQPPRQ